MNHKHFKQILIYNNIFPLNLSETKLALKLRNSLLEYCKLDTLAMVKILEKLRKIK